MAAMSSAATDRGASPALSIHHGFTVETITRDVDLETIAEEWAELDRTLSPRTPFTSPDWCRTWWRHFRRTGSLARDELRVFVVREAGRLVAVAPMMITFRPAFGPVRTRELQFFGADPNMTEIRGPICRAERSADVAKALDAHFARSNEWDWAQWRGLRSSEEEAACPRDMRLQEPRQQVDFVLDLPASWEAFRASLPRNIKESLRKCYNSLARDGHAFELRVLDRPEDAKAAIERFMTLHGARAQADAAVSHINVFESAAPRSFLLDFGEDVAGRGGLRVFQLVIADKVVATRVGFALGDELYLYYSGYDQDWGRYSVMTTVVAEAIRWAIERGFKAVNLSTGDDVSKTRWRPREIRYSGGFKAAPTIRGQIIGSVMESLRRRRLILAEAAWATPAAARQPARRPRWRQAFASSVG